ncbi:nuclear transport factor 2 family protein [Ramlibacter sp. WS9]|uniref:nuclear transport factor 2 family protein n=1 Tax=Ramlibacter sp. WS9 TaxID=1882741 RepID=UPI001142AE43|nr:nuclear transport factor 2 family protein [Ramlibacter sp. WS9]ROZ75094.1 nuclear transport factor 2 family protein [Ramlibacter sp. WS9]
MSTSTLEDRNIALAKEYFIRGDAQRPDLLDLFHADFELYFPKFGIGRGPESFLQMASGFAGDLEAIEHDFTQYNFIATGPYVVVEGTTRGRMKGKAWSAGETPGGRFCNVFEFRDGLIARVHVHLDPDYLGEDEARFRWGRAGRVW